ncbi:hypothetical protein J6590_024362 [Homalodisca vitripennis]|nr:hypothetical protein J6590_024362 [Homalodisca vitripennis]
MCCGLASKTIPEEITRVVMNWQRSVLCRETPPVRLPNRRGTLLGQVPFTSSRVAAAAERGAGEDSALEGASWAGTPAEFCRRKRKPLAHRLEGEHQLQASTLQVAIEPRE